MQTDFYVQNAHSIEREISENLSRIWDIAEDSTPTIWTAAVNTILATTAKQNNRKYFTASKLRTCENPEWLYDFVWYDNNEFGLNNVYLVVESEWKNPWGNEDYCYDIQYDFEKLILARSPYKLMIFEGDNLEENSQYLDTLKKVVLNCQLTKAGDRYMFAAWDKEKQEFYFDLLIAN